MVTDVPAFATAVPLFVTTTVEVDVQPFASVAVTVYEPAVRFEIVSFVDELLHTYVYPGVPPVALTEALPSAAPQFSGIEFPVTAIAVGCVKVTVCVCAHPSLPVTVTVYVPAERPVALAAVPPEGDQE